jgi:4'-phosphopantetheinyl transferase
MTASATVHLVDGRRLDDARVSELVPWLSAAEQARYQRFVRAERRRQFLIGRVLARKALGQLLETDPRTLLIEDRPGQAPVLSGFAGIAFSISHSGPWIACAVSASAAVGLDIEQLDPSRDIDALAAQSFSAERCAWLAARPDATRLRDFYVLWSTQEARIKLGAEPVSAIELPHPDLSIILCSDRKISLKTGYVPTMGTYPVFGETVFPRG